MVTNVNPDVLNPRMNAVLEVMSPDEAMSVDEIADRMGVNYFAVYPYVRKLDEMALIKAQAFRRDNKKVYILADLTKTPKIHTLGPDKPPVEIYKIANSAALARNKGTENGVYINNFPYMLLRLYDLALSVQAGHAFDRAIYQGIRGDMISLRNRLEIMLGGLNEILAHPVLSGNPTILTDTLLGDPNCPLDRETVSNLIKQCEQKEAQ